MYSKIETKDSLKKLCFTCNYVVQDYFTFTVSVVSGKYSGEDSFCSSKSIIKRFINDLTKMYKNMEGKTTINDSDSDSFFTFEMFKNGSFEISGQVGGSHQNHYLKLKFITDQTSLPVFIDSFKDNFI